MDDFVNDLPPTLRKKAGELGPQISVHEFLAYKTQLYVFIAGACFFIALLMTCGGIGTFGRDLGGALTMLAMAVVTVVAGILVLRFLSKNKGRKVILCENGLVHVQKGGSSVIAWDEIEEAYQKVIEVQMQGVGSETTHDYTIVLSDKRSLVFSDNLEEVVRLGNTIHEEVARARLPGMLALFDQGKPVKFGCLAVSKEGLTQNSDFIAWHEIDGVKVQGGYFVISKKGKWLRWGGTEVAEIPNPMALLELVRHATGGGDRMSYPHART